MTLQAGHFAIWTGSYRPWVATVAAVLDKTVRIDLGGGSVKLVHQSSIAAYGPDREKIEKATARMVSATSEGIRRKLAADQYVQNEHARIAKEAMS
jgi:hypothetical protein